MRACVFVHACVRVCLFVCGVCLLTSALLTTAVAENTLLKTDHK